MSKNYSKVQGSRLRSQKDKRPLVDIAKDIIALKPITLATWNTLYMHIYMLMRAHYGSNTQSPDAVHDRLTLFIQYIQQYDRYCVYCRENGLQVPKLWEYLNKWKLNYTAIETYFTLKQRNINWLTEGKLIRNWMTEQELTDMGEVLTIYFKHHPSSHSEWVYHWVQWKASKGKSYYGRQAQANFLSKVIRFEAMNEVVASVEHRYRGEGSQYAEMGYGAETGVDSIHDKRRELGG